MIMDNLEGSVLNVIALDDKDYKERMRFEVFENGSVAFTGGFCYHLLLVLQQALRFDYKPLRAIGWSGTVRKYPKRMWTQMVGEVIYRRADLSISQASMVMLQQPIRQISYLLPTSTSRLAAIFRQPQLTRDLLIIAFDLNTWLGVGFTWLAILITLRIISKVICKESLSILRMRRYERIDLILWCVGTSCGQGWHDLRKEGLFRIAYMTALSFTFLLTNVFSASLTSILATEEIPIKTFDDLARSTLNIYGDYRLPVARNLVKELYKKHRGVNISSFKDPHFINVNVSMKKIVKEAAAFITLEDAAKSMFRQQGYDEEFFCSEIHSVFTTAGVIQNAMFIKRGSNLREIFNRKIALINQLGLTFRLNLIYKRNTITTCPVISLKYRGGLSIKDILTGFMIMMAGIFASFLGLLCEQCLWK